MRRRLALTAAALVLLVIGGWLRDPAARLVSPRLFDGTVLEATYTPTPVRSIQPVSITLSAAATSATATLSPTITATNAVLIFQGTTGNDTGGGTLGSDMLVGTITSGTTITASRVGNNTIASLTYNGTVVEFLSPFVKSQGCGNTAAIADDGVSTTATATIPSVNTAKTFVAYTGATSTSTSTWGSGAGAPGFIFVRLALTAATTITATRATATATTYGTTPGYCYVEFK